MQNDALKMYKFNLKTQEDGNVQTDNLNCRCEIKKGKYHISLQLNEV